MQAPDSLVYIHDDGVILQRDSDKPIAREIQLHLHLRIDTRKKLSSECRFSGKTVNQTYLGLQLSSDSG